MTLLLKLNLQFFSEDNSHPFAAESAPPEAHPFSEASTSKFAGFTEVENPLLADNNAPETPQLQPTESQSQGLQGEPSAESQVEELDFGGRKVKVVDPIIHDLHKDYSHLTRTYQQANQELAEAVQREIQWQQWADQQEEMQYEEPEQQTFDYAEAVSSERQQALNDEYMERMYENKFAADQWWNSQPEIAAQLQSRQQAEFQAALDERLAPYEEERQATRLQQQSDQFIQSNPDVGDYGDAMQEILNENPSFETLPNALEVLYTMAKARTTPATPSFENMIADPNNLQKILANEQIRSAVFQSYQQNKTQSNQNLPNVMGNPTGSQTPMSAGERAPRSIAEGTKNWMRSIGQ